MVYLNDTTTIRSELEGYIKQHNLNITQFSKLAGLNPGTMSAILNGNRVMAVNQLDRITATLTLPDGYFYEQYIQEYLNEASPNWRRIRPFLYRCSELGKLECIRQVLELLMDNLLYSPLLFETAEVFFQEGQKEAAILLFECVAANERSQYSERLAFCQYRLFTLKLGDDQEQNLLVTHQFEPYVDRLDETDQLDALKDLVNTYRSLRQWDKVKDLAQQMGHKARIQYKLEQRQTRKNSSETKKASKPLFVYIAYSSLLQAAVCDARKDYKQALRFTYDYADLSWVKETDPESVHWKGLFEHWAQVNTYVNKLMMGDISILPKYVEYIGGKKEIFAELLNIVEAANLYNIDVDPILDRFSDAIMSYEQQPGSGDVYTQQVIPEQATRFWYELAKYYLRNGHFSSGFRYLFKAMEKSSEINNKTVIINCVGLYERFKNFAVDEIQHQYQFYIKKVWAENEKSDPIVSNY
ncbi:transcriptional regulator [Paenibacillus jiagnxiensis]|uniref:transcriptional regulator n=1 Tax=Paenibacillus jiagnxiensis TaxID=3228926 RepID=UPI0038D4C781